MTNCNKYKVIWRSADTQEIENWLNELYEKEGLELIAVDEHDYIFKVNYQVKRVEDFIEE